MLMRMSVLFLIAVSGVCPAAWQSITDYGNEQDIMIRPGAELDHGDSQELLVKAKASLANNSDLDSAMEYLSEILLQPNNPCSQEALELYGVALERSGKTELAKAKYASYLSLYPDTDSTTRVRQRLLALEIQQPAAETQILGQHGESETTNTISASDSEYWMSDSSTNRLGSWHSDTNLLLNNISVTDTYRSEELSVRSVLRYTKSQNLADRGTSRDELSSAYINAESQSFGIKLGRQSAAWGTSNRFDGAVVTWTRDSDVKLSALGGVPVTLGDDTPRRFFGLGLDVNLSRAWFVSAYMNQQTANGKAERSVLGADLRYYQDGMSLGSVLEYDWALKAVADLALHANSPTSWGSWYLVMDHRNAAVTTDQILVTTPQGSVPLTVGLAKTLTVNQIDQIISSAANRTDIMSLGAVRQLDKTWSLGLAVSSSRSAQPTNQIVIQDIQNITAAGISVPVTGFSSRGLDLTVKSTDIWGPRSSATGIVSWNSNAGVNQYSLTGDANFPWENCGWDLVLRVQHAQGSMSDVKDLYLAVRLIKKFNDTWSSDALIGLEITDITNAVSSNRSINYGKSIYYGLRADF